MDNEVVVTRDDGTTLRAFGRLEWTLWALLTVQACLLVATAIAVAWIYFWEQSLAAAGGSAIAPVGGA